MPRKPWIIAGTVGLLAGACDDSITHPKLFPNGLQAEAGSPQGDGGHVLPPHECIGACCPAAAECTATSTSYSGPECLAQYDNSKPETRWQLRQTWSKSEVPLGNAVDPVAQILSLRSQLTWPTCNMNPADIGTFMQLVDFDLTNKVGRVGFSRFTGKATLATDLSQGLCMVEDTYADTTWGLTAATNMAMGPNWPVGLPAPMILPFNAAPIKAKGLDDDFDLKADRASILAKFAQGGEYAAAGYTGIFYLNQQTGYLHGYGPIAYVIVYDSATAVNMLPIREGEITAQINDPEHPNCVGIYRGDALGDPSNGCPSSTNVPAWGCANNECPPGQGPNVTKGYFLITEVEQVYNNFLSQTICNVDAANVENAQGVKNGYGTDPAPTTSCRDWPKWDPTKLDQSGLPNGDWCAETNSPATATCHDAFRSISYATFQGFKIQAGTCPAF